MKIIEKACVAKGKKRAMEDAIVITDNFIAVIDGSTSKSKKRYSLWYSNGAYCAHIISRYLHRAPKTLTFEQFAKGVSQAVIKHYKKSQWQHLAEHPEDRLTASVVVYSRLQRQIWMIGDCQCLVNDELYDNPKPMEAEIANLRSLEAHRLLSDGSETLESLMKEDISRKAIIPQLIESMQGQNKTYSVVDGFPIPMAHTRVITLDFRPWTIVLASDGYPFLCPTLEESEQALCKQLADDPLCINSYKATKGLLTGNVSFDDRTYIRFSI
ncbi:MAG: PP2C family serine/threonine-protein phosphatase [Prevotellaceae bacterium]|nr:PP2C family serine/threonine-protein phosphatase [Prevotellaceae bacterium]